MRFTKMQGAGNDYIYVNCFEETVNNRDEVAKKVSDRHLGIGSDGLIIIEPSEVADFKMDMYNSDGSQGKMCGNAIRCISKYVYDNKMTDKEEISIETLSGIKYIKVNVKDGKVVSARADMGKPILEPKQIPAMIDTIYGNSILKLNAIVSQPLIVGEYKCLVTCVSMGNPHCVLNVPSIKDIEIEKLGPKFENHQSFPDKINTEFIELVDDKTIKMRVWERGSGETLACGTGACASVVACILNGYCKKDEDVKVILLGGELIIRWDSSSGSVFMTGPAVTVFTGEIDI